MKWLNLCHYQGMKAISRTPLLKYSAFEISEAVCKVLDVSLEELKSNVRTRRISDARKIYTLLCLSLSSQTLKQIGKSIHKDHSTIIYQRDFARDLIKSDRLFLNQYFTVKESIKPIYE